MEKFSFSWSSRIATYLSVNRIWLMDVSLNASFRVPPTFLKMHSPPEDAHFPSPTVAFHAESSLRGLTPALLYAGRAYPQDRPLLLPQTSSPIDTPVDRRH